MMLCLKTQSLFFFKAESLQHFLKYCYLSRGQQIIRFNQIVMTIIIIIIIIVIVSVYVSYIIAIFFTW